MSILTGDNPFSAYKQKIEEKKQEVTKRNPVAKALSQPQFKTQTIKNKKAYNRKKDKKVSMDEKLSKSADMGDWIDDFEKSDAPQFQGKSKEKRRQMAIAAKLNSEDNEVDEAWYGTKKVKRPTVKKSREKIPDWNKGPRVHDNPVRNKYIKKGLIKNDVNEEEDYSAKKAAAGKDIGKPGKNFSKIADKAAKKYGSKEAGDKVAGAILANLRK